MHIVTSLSISIYNVLLLGFYCIYDFICITHHRLYITCEMLYYATLCNGILQCIILHISCIPFCILYITKYIK